MIESGESLKYQERANFTVFGAADINLDEQLTTLPMINWADFLPDTTPGPYIVSFFYYRTLNTQSFVKNLNGPRVTL